MTTSKPPFSARRASSPLDAGALVRLRCRGRARARRSPVGLSRALTSARRPACSGARSGRSALIRRSSGSGQQTSESPARASLRRQVTLLRGQERQHGLQRVEAEVLAGWDADPARLGEVEVVPRLESQQTDRPSILTTVTRRSWRFAVLSALAQSRRRDRDGQAFTQLRRLEPPASCGRTRPGGVRRRPSR